ncbi:DUF5788 family protein [Halobaculum lipolyticum]|uniref:DUF5788 family protein n=1 Tax=Halobaculum lipolyticum TaxID=3032001 RepID=A0ABD5WGR9_9EURY|nr:DUF5788 family protein [Halobaculum sp. DT31]
MDDSERRRLLDRLRGGSTVGFRMPDRIEVDGTTIELKRLVFESERLDAVTEAERERVDEALGLLRRERTRRRRRIAEGDISVAEGDALADEVIGIDRAINALEGLDAPGFGEEARRSRIEGHKEWLGLVNQLR